MKYFKSIKKSYWSLIENLSSPAITALLTPFFLKFLGIDIFAQYILVKTIIAMGGIVSFGMNQSITKIISLYSNSKNSKILHKKAIRSSITVSIFSLIFILIFIFPLSWEIMPSLFNKIGDKNLIQSLLVFALMQLYLEQIDSIFVGALRGLEQFKLSAKLEFITRIVTMFSSLFVAYLTKDLFIVLKISLISNLMRVLFKGVILSKVVGSIVIIPGWDYQILKRLINFGKWNWLQYIGSVIENSGNKMIIASMLGPEALAIYTICSTLAQVIFLVPSSSLYWIFPKASKLSKENRYIPVPFYDKSTIANLFISIPLGFFIILFGKKILSIWISPEFADKNYLFFILISSSWLITSLFVSTHNLLLGYGEEKYLGKTNFLAGICSCLATSIFLNIFNIYGLVLGRIMWTIIEFRKVFYVRKILE